MGSRYPDSSIQNSEGRQESFPRCGTLFSMAWKNRKPFFHGVEKPDGFFHGVETFFP
jgi:hypothetical protein